MSAPLVRPPGAASSVVSVLVRALTLLPRSVVATVRAVGRGRGREAVVGAFGIGLGVWAWVVAFLVALGFARGPLYGFVVSGPYDDAWGGPTLAGAWAVHAAVWVGVLVAAFGMWWAIVALADLVAAHVRGERRSAWSVPVAMVLLVAAAGFVVLWSRQV